MRLILGSFLLAFAPAPVQDAGFRFLDPEAHATVASAAPSRTADEALLEHSQAAVGRLLADAGIEAQVDGRVKSLLSTHRKMIRKGVGIDEVYDRVALRVRVDEVDHAYAALDLLHDAFEPIPGELDDYIASPKPNGYRSLHTAVRVGGDPVEVQLRTHEMHAQAELGDAAHWRYKLG